ncbi:single-stranded-DNA-specific exonuclease RecJ [Gorillibacterium massiliense]|uniref:single-stranded-DNA-specific exonuclease RecJ n=1 Tax=Gorillibacterium massiliense TaxID=1280390 RepID=UPI0004B725C0|nr:single-stranded-DNA-specific exonuclease RecJ [Gorillibacterium massiliense]
MLPAKARWTIGSSDESVVREFTESLGLEPMLARLLAARGFRTPEEAAPFLAVGSGQFHDPFLLDGMHEAVARIRLALERHEKIRIYGDYDADGVSSVALMIFLFRQLDADFDYYIPHRVSEGYGLNRGALELAKEEGVSLLVTVDTGISAKVEVEYASSLGLDVVVTDHHEPPEELPIACAVVNPKKPGCPYPFKHLAGAGVAFKLAQALLGRIPVELLEIAAIGTVGDLMPLTGENRAIVKLGLDHMRVTANPGIRALLDVAGVDREKVTAGNIGFGIAPRINASGRLEAADDAVRLLVTASKPEAEEVAAALDNLNKERQRIVDEIFVEAAAIAESAIADGSGKVLVVAKENWNVGVIGIVASKLVDKYYRPVLVLSINPETGLAKGSARSIPGFDMYKALTHCAEMMDHYGGHQAAAGMTLEAANLNRFRAELQTLAAEWLSEEDYIPVLHADMTVDLSEDPMGWIGSLEKLGPFGMGNPSPRFVFTGLHVLEKRTMGKDNRHLKLSVSQRTSENRASAFDAVGFSRSQLVHRISDAARMDILGELSINEWNGSRKAQIIIQDMRIAERQVFDWRGAKDTDPRWSTLTAADSRGLNRSAPLCGVVVSSSSEAEEAGRLPLPAGTTFWAPDSSGTMKCVEGVRSSEAEHDPIEPTFDRVQDLILYSMPDSLEELSRLLHQSIGLERIYAVFRESQPEGVVPTRDMFKQVYSMLLKPDDRYQGGHKDVIGYFSARSGLSRDMVTFIIEVFEELSLVERWSGGYRCVPAAVKRDLTTSSRYKRRLKWREAEQELMYTSSKELTRILLNAYKDNQSVTEVQA